jgi:Tetratricopeptide repeat
MSSVLAILGAEIFRKARDANGRPLALGSVYPTTTYASTNRAIASKLDADLYLVTVHEGRLWIAAVLRGPRSGAKGWAAKPNVVRVVDIQHLVPRLRFDSGAGINAKQMAMSLQTPRGLTDADIALLEGAIAGRGKGANKGATRAAAGKVTPATIEAVVVMITARILGKTEAAVRADRGRWAAFQQDDSFEADEIDWERLRWDDDDGDGSEVYGRRDIDLARSLVWSEQLTATATTDRALRDWCVDGERPLYGQQVRTLVKADRIASDSLWQMHGRIQAKGDSLVGAMTALLRMRDPRKLHTKPSELAETEKAHRKFVDEIEVAALRPHVAMFFQSAHAARCTGAYFAGADSDNAGALGSGYEVVASWELGEGQGELFLARIVDDHISAVPPFKGRLLLRKKPPRPVEKGPKPKTFDALLATPLSALVKAAGGSELAELLGSSPDAKLKKLAGSKRSLFTFRLACNGALQSGHLRLLAAVTTRALPRLPPKVRLAFEDLRSIALTNLGYLDEARSSALHCLELHDRPTMESAELTRSRAHNQVAWIAYLRRDIDAALDHAQQALALDRNNPNAAGTLAVILYDAGRTAEAFKRLDAFMKQGMDPEPVGPLLEDARYHELCMKHGIPIALTDELARRFA